MLVLINYLIGVRSLRGEEAYNIRIVIENSPICNVIRNRGLKINSIENLSGLKSSEGIRLEATFAKRSALAFWSLGIDEILNAIKCSVRSCTKDW